MSTLIDGLPALDCHAHIAPDVTAAQLQALGSAHIFAVTRSLDEAEQAVSRRDARVTWGLGLHPAVAAARAAWDPDQFARLLPSFALVGEVGLDKRAGHLPVQQGLFRDVLGLCSHEAVLISVHSSGATAAVTKMLAEQPHPGVILHWFLGSHEEIRTAVESGAYFSVNSGMTHAASAALPSDRVLTETDFPARQPQSKAACGHNARRADPRRYLERHAGRGKSPLLAQPSGASDAGASTRSASRCTRRSPP